MADAQERLWQVVIGAKRRAHRRLENTLATQRRELASLQQEAAARQAEAEAARERLEACEHSVVELSRSREPVPAQRFLEYGAWRQVLSDRRSSAEDASQRASDAVDEKRRQISDTTRQIARVEAQKKMCESRLEKHRQVQEENLQQQIDEEAAEAIGALRSRQSRWAS